ncbi:MAG: hypothetical protein WB791_03010 [Waddliaceae bacterium]
MNTNASQKLQELGDQFLKWRQNNPHRHIPRNLWDKALLLAEKHDVKKVAKEIGFPANYIRRKIKKRLVPNPTVQKFVEVRSHPNNPLEVSQGMKLRIQQSGGTMAELFFQGSVEQVFPLMRMLLRENLCSN